MIGRPARLAKRRSPSGDGVRFFGVRDPGVLGVTDFEKHPHPTVQHWEPRTKAEREMLPRFRGMSKQKRMDRALQNVMSGEWNISESARNAGVSRGALHVRIKEARAQLAAQEERIEEARAHKAGEVQAEPAEVPALHVSGERRRVGTFQEFNARYFGNEVCPDCGVHHETPEFHNEMMDLLEDRGRRMKLVNLAPYHAKSTTATMKSTLYEICRDPSSRTAIISRATPLAKAFLYQIKQHLTDPDLYNGAEGNLIDDFGPFYNPNHWSEDQIYIAGRSGAQKEPTVSVYGYGTQIYGRRFDRMIFDDIADLDNQNTPEAIDKMYRKMWQEYANRVGKTGQLIWVGTRVNSGDIYSKLDEVEGINILRYPCILDEDNREVLWPEHYPFEVAAQQRDAMGEVEFQLVYQNVDLPGLSASYTPDLLERAHDPKRFLGEFDSRWAFVLGLDPAGANAQAGYTAMVVMALDLESQKRHLVDLVNVKSMKAPQVLEQIMQFADQYPLRELRVEVNGLQAQLYQYNEELNAKLVSKGVKLQPHVTHKGNKWDPQWGVEAMATLFHNQMISTPWADVATRKKFRELEQQLLQVPMNLNSKTAPSDLVMAMWFAALGCRDIQARTAIPMFDSRMRVPGRIRKNRRVVDFGEKHHRAPSRDEEVGNWMGRPGPAPAAERFVNVPGGVR